MNLVPWDTSFKDHRLDWTRAIRWYLCRTPSASNSRDYSLLKCCLALLNFLPQLQCFSISSLGKERKTHSFVCFSVLF